jgi:hypothetical protein
VPVDGADGLGDVGGEGSMSGPVESQATRSKQSATVELRVTVESERKNVVGIQRQW